MRFLHQPVFSRIDRGKNTEILDWARKKETNLAEICHKCHPTWKSIATFAATKQIPNYECNY